MGRTVKVLLRLHEADSMLFFGCVEYASFFDTYDWMLLGMISV
jgi:hypothetical protein